MTGAEILSSIAMHSNERMRVLLSLLVILIASKSGYINMSD